MRCSLDSFVNVVYTKRTMKGTANITIDFRQQAAGSRQQAAGSRQQAAENYGAEFGFVKYVAPNPSLFVPLFPLKYYTAADNFFPHTVAGGKSVLELGNSDTELGKSARNGGNSILNGSNSIVTGGNPNMELGNSIANGGNSGAELGNSIPKGGNPISKLGNFASNGGNSAPHKNKEKL